MPKVGTNNNLNHINESRLSPSSESELSAVPTILEEDWEDSNVDGEDDNVDIIENSVQLAASMIPSHKKSWHPAWDKSMVSSK
jgi:hypothetical protein